MPQSFRKRKTGTSKQRGKVFPVGGSKKTSRKPKLIVSKKSFGIRKHLLMTEEIRKKLPALYSQENVEDPVVHVKFFDPFSNWTWYAIEFDGKDRFFGYVVGHDKEMGYFSLKELENVKNRLGLPIERDLYFKPVKLSKISSDNKSFVSENIKKKKPKVTYNQAEGIHTILRSNISQATDEALIAKEQFPKTSGGNYSRWTKKMNTSDIEGIDVGTDIRTRKVGVGKDKPIKTATKTELEKHPFMLRGNKTMEKRFQPIVDEKFKDLKDHPMSQREIRITDTNMRNVGGYYQSAYRRNKKTGKLELVPYEIAIKMKGSSKEWQDNSMIHEGIHFRRHVQLDAKMRKFINDSDREEKETVHETTARAGSNQIKTWKNKGYYGYVDRPYPTVRLEDMGLLKVYSKSGLIDSDKIERNITNFQKKTFLNKVRISRRAYSDFAGKRVPPPENIDIYLKTSEGDLYHFYSPNKKADVKKLAVFVDNADGVKGEERVYEYRDGKPVLVKQMGKIKKV